MKNKNTLHLNIKLYCFISLLFIILFLFLHHLEYHAYTKGLNQKLEAIIVELQKNYPNLSKNDLIKILNEPSNTPTNSLSIYGIDIEKDTYLLQNETIYHTYHIIFCILSISICILFFLLHQSQTWNIKKKIKKLTYYLEEMNNKNYSLYIEENEEDELSILKNELYKTTILLKESAENSLQDKKNLKESLSNISHQLKTPLTSILISLENILENPNMPQDTRIKFIKSIKRETINMSFLVENLLKMTKFDANTITFYPKEVTLNSVIEEAIQNVSLISDLKDIHIKLEKKDPITLTCDRKWQIEALTNILKNCIEHSQEHSVISIFLNQNKIYTEIKIKDNGHGISKKDLPHIFKRFYKSQNSSSESVGIGLSLAKSIIEKDNGYITVESNLDLGTTFTIKYFQN